VPSLLQELPALVGSFRALSPSAFEVWGDRYAVVADERPSDRAALGAAATGRLADVLYSTLHCRLTIEAWSASLTIDPVRARAFVHALSQSNCGKGPWQTGWVMRSVTDDGRYLVEHLGARFAASPDAVRAQSDRPSPGETIAVRAPSEYRHLIAGFYTVLGDADDSLEHEPTTRVYWHLRASGAEELTRHLTAALNERGVPFWLKLADAPEKYRRSDVAVLYLPRAAYPRAESVIAHAARSLAGHLRASTSAFAMRIAPGVAVADDPAFRESFGQHRSRILAEALTTESAKGGAITAERVAAALATSGIDPTAPHRDPGSESTYRTLDQVLHDD
jgi:hypothetical protein